MPGRPISPRRVRVVPSVSGKELDGGMHLTTISNALALEPEEFDPESMPTERVREGKEGGIRACCMGGAAGGAAVVAACGEASGVTGRADGEPSAVPEQCVVS